MEFSLFRLRDLHTFVFLTQRPPSSSFPYLGIHLTLMAQLPREAHRYPEP